MGRYSIYEVDNGDYNEIFSSDILDDIKFSYDCIYNSNNESFVLRPLLNKFSDFCVDFNLFKCFYEEEFYELGYRLYTGADGEEKIRKEDVDETFLYKVCEEFVHSVVYAWRSNEEYYCLVDNETNRTILGQREHEEQQEKILFEYLENNEEEIRNIVLKNNVFESYRYEVFGTDGDILIKTNDLDEAVENYNDLFFGGKYHKPYAIKKYVEKIEEDIYYTYNRIYDYFDNEEHEEISFAEYCNCNGEDEHMPCSVLDYTEINLKYESTFYSYVGDGGLDFLSIGEDCIYPEQGEEFLSEKQIRTFLENHKVTIEDLTNVGTVFQWSADIISWEDDYKTPRYKLVDVENGITVFNESDYEKFAKEAFIRYYGGSDEVINYHNFDRGVISLEESEKEKKIQFSELKELTLQRIEENSKSSDNDMCL